MGKVKDYFFDEIERDSYKWDEYEHYRDSTYGDTEDIYNDYVEEYKQFLKNMTSTPISVYPYEEGLEEAAASLSGVAVPTTDILEEVLLEMKNEKKDIPF